MQKIWWVGTIFSIAGCGACGGGDANVSPKTVDPPPQVSDGGAVGDAGAIDPNAAGDGGANADGGASAAADGGAADGGAASVIPADAITNADNGKTVTRKIGGDPLVIALTANATTGFQWMVAKVDPGLGDPKTSYVMDPGGANVIGNGGRATFTWQLLPRTGLKGSHTIDLVYKRSWETDVKPTRIFTVTVVLTD